jgi:hypothetical protein
MAELTLGATAALRRAVSSWDRGPGMLVTRRRACGNVGPPTAVVDVDIGLLELRVGG